MRPITVCLLQSMLTLLLWVHFLADAMHAVADPGGAKGAMAPPPGPVKIGHKKDGRRRQPHRFHVSRPPPYPAAGSATGMKRAYVDDF